MNRPSGSCCGCDDDSAALAFASARSKILSAVHRVEGQERIPLHVALQRRLAEAMYSPHAVPGYDNSAMDGYALRSVEGCEGARLPCVGSSFAGHPYARTVGAGECVRIMTGAVMPDGADSVVMQERVTVDGDAIILHQAVSQGDHVRRAGEDLQAGSVALSAGSHIGPAQLGMLASLGMAEVVVRRRPRVVILSTGDELCGLGQPLQPGMIYDSNRHILYGLLQSCGVELLDMGIIADDLEQTRQAFAVAASQADMVITTAGVSVGDADYVKQVLSELGEVEFWKIAIKPGKPLAFGHIGSAVFFGLPGNPVSTMVSFHQFVRPALLKMAGGDVSQGQRLQASIREDIVKNPGRLEFQRGILTQDASGCLQVASTGNQSSGVLSSMVKGNCYIVLPATSHGVKAGQMVQVEPFAANFFSGGDV